MYGRTDVRTYGRNFSPFYRTLSPVGAAAQKLLHRTKIHDVLLAFTLDMKKKDLSARVCDFIEIQTQKSCLDGYKF